MTGAFKDLNRSDIYLTEHTATKLWKIQEREFRNLKISKFYAISGPEPVIDKPVRREGKDYYRLETERRPIYGGDRIECTLPDSVEPYVCFESGSYFPALAYRGLDLEYYRASESGEFEGAFSGSYNNSIQSTITIEGSRKISDRILAYSIPRSCMGLRLNPETISVVSNSGKRYTDREGVLLDESSKIVGDIIYDRGLILVTDSEVIETLTEGEILEFETVKNIVTQNINCSIRDSEFNYTYNASAKKLQNEGRVFTPYITSVGLYNTRGELVAVAKLSKPIKKDADIDMTIRVQIDM